MDDRWYRSPRHRTGEYYGELQLNWLIDALKYSAAPFKFVCTGGQILNDAAVFENYAQFPRERQMMIDSLDKYNIKGVVFLTGDRHHSEITRMVTADGDIFYDITSSAMTSTTFPHPDEPNTLRIPGSMIGVRNYALLSVSGPGNARKCSVMFKDANGVVLFEHELN
jgi:alkaline phosphatase D